MARKMAAVLVVLGLCGLVVPAMARQEVEGRISDTPKIVFFGTEVSDKEPLCGTSFDPLIRVLNTPQAGSNEPLRLSVESLPAGSFYLYATLMMGRDYLVFNGVRVVNGSLVAIPAPASAWQPGTYAVKVIIATGQFWTVVKDNLYQTVAINCCNGIEVEQLHVTVKSPPPACCPSPCPPPPPPCTTCRKPCTACGIVGIIAGILLLNQIFCCP